MMLLQVIIVGIFIGASLPQGDGTFVYQGDGTFLYRIYPFRSMGNTIQVYSRPDNSDPFRSIGNTIQVYSQPDNSDPFRSIGNPIQFYSQLDNSGDNSNEDSSERHNCRVCLNAEGQPFCCDNARMFWWWMDRPGSCPPVRPTCPVRQGSAPTRCVRDSDCPGGVDKCCYDTCLGHKVCKSPT